MVTTENTERIQLENGISYQIEVIDADLAREYLRWNKDNRKPSKPWVRTLVMRQKRGEWRFTGDPIRFDRDGYLRDGQHRLEMVMETGIPIKVPVIRGLEPDVFMVLDIGKKRELDTVLYIMDYPWPSPLAAVVREVWAYLANQVPTGVSNEMFVDFLKSHPEIVRSVEFYQDRKGHQSVNLVGFPKPLMVAHYLLSRIDPDQAESFLTKVMYGGDAAPAAVLTLRTTLNKWWRPGPKERKSPDRAALFAIIQVWNMVQAGKESKAQVRTPSSKKLRSPRGDRPSDLPRGFPKDLFFTPNRQLTLIDMEQAEEGDEEEPETE